MLYLTRHIGENRGAPRLFLDQHWLQRHGFVPGAALQVVEDREQRRLTLKVSEQGERHVSRKKTRNGGLKPVIDIAGAILGMFLSREPVRVVITHLTITILPLAQVIAQRERLDRILAKIALKQPLTVASFAHGIGVACHAAHSGLTVAGVQATVQMISDIDARYLEQSMEHNPAVRDCTTAIVAPIQEVVQDRWLMSRLPPVEVLEMGLSCSGASVAGRAKRGAGMAEDHPEVGHLVVPALMIAKDLQPAIIFVESVVQFKHSASAQLLRFMLRDMGYHVHEEVLRGNDFGSLEQRERWFLVATTNGLEVDISGLAEQESLKAGPLPTVASIIEQIPDDHPSWRTFDYIATKAARDEAKGSNFKPQLVRAEDQKIPTLRKFVWKGGSTDPRLAHPTDPALSRLFTAKEHSLIKGVPAAIIEDASSTLAHEGLGQSVTHRVVEALFERIGTCLKACRPADKVVQTQLGYSLAQSTG